MPTTWPPPSSGAVGSVSLIKKTVPLLTVVTSMGPLNGIDRRGCRLNPSSVLRRVTSSKSDGCVARSGSGRLTRRPVSWLESATVNRSLGNGPLSRAPRSNAANVLGTQRSSRVSRRGRQVLVRVVMTTPRKRDGLRYHARVTHPGAQTERRGGAGPVGRLLGGKVPSGRLFLPFVSPHHGKLTT